MERSTKETLSTEEQKEISSSLGHRYTQETPYDTMGHVVVL